jgi:hypothetical protein
VNLLWLVRLRRWLRHSPSPRLVIVVLGVVGVMLGLAAVEHFLGWPEALTVDGRGFRRPWR